MNSIYLLFAAMIWGVAFVAQKVGMDYMGPLTFNGIRFLIGGIVLLPIVISKEKNSFKNNEYKKLTIQGGLLCGVAICIASLFQQYGIIYTTVGKSGFVTALYIVIVPILGIFLHKRNQNKIWISVIMSVIGLYLLCINGQFVINKGDALVFVGAILFAIHILVIDYYSPKANPITLSCIQFLFSGLACSLLAFIFEVPSWTQITNGIIPILYAGILSCGVAYTFQMLGQRTVDPTIASLILSLESVVSVVAGWIILNQTLSFKEMFGCLFVLFAVVLVQLSERERKYV